MDDDPKVGGGTIRGQAEPEGSAKTRSRRPKPVRGEVDFDTLVTSVMKQFAKTRARPAQ